MFSSGESPILGAITSVSFLLGLGMMFASLFYRRADAPMIGSTNPEHRKPIWKLKSRYRGPGFVLLLVGSVLFFEGMLVHLLFVGW